MEKLLTLALLVLSFMSNASETQYKVSGIFSNDIRCEGIKTGESTWSDDNILLFNFPEKISFSLKNEFTGKKDQELVPSLLIFNTGIAGEIQGEIGGGFHKKCNKYPCGFSYGGGRQPGPEEELAYFLDLSKKLPVADQDNAKFIDGGVVFYHGNDRGFYQLNCITN